MGVQLFRPYVVSSVMGSGEVLSGRVNEVVLLLNRWDQENKRMDFSVRSYMILADLLILATGAGAAEDRMITETLGFSYERLKPVNYMAIGIFDHGQEPENDPAFNDIQEAAEKIAAGGGICFKCGEYDYLLSSLSGITTGDFQRLKQDQKLLQDLVTALKRASMNTTGEREKIKDVKNNILAFAINIQRARQMYSTKYPAVLVGDAAVTPHPDTGMGVTSGFRGFEALKELLGCLKSEPGDGLESYLKFNARYEKHVCEKALDGTMSICSNLIGLLASYRARLGTLREQTTDVRLRKLYEIDIGTSERLTKALTSAIDTAKTYIENWEPWSEGPGRLWRFLEETWEIIEALTKQKSLLQPQLEALQRTAGFIK
jgi:hypothetical protein